MEKLLNHNEASTLIPQWTCAMEESEFMEVKRIILDALANVGISASVEFAPVKEDSQHLLCGRAWHWIDVTLHGIPEILRNSRDKSTVKGLSTIKLAVLRCSGFMTYEAASKFSQFRNKVGLLNISVSEKYAIIDNYKFDAQALEVHMVTNGYQRAYRGRTWWNYEAYMNDNYGDWRDIEMGIKKYIRDMVRDLELPTMSQRNNVA